MKELCAVIEAILFVSGDPVRVEDLAHSMNMTASEMETALTVLEPLSLIAYRQPVTKSDIEQVRGVKCDYSVQALLAKGLIEEAGRREALGRPILYRTTDAFLRHFGISTLEELPQVDFKAPTEEMGT